MKFDDIKFLNGYNYTIDSDGFIIVNGDFSCIGMGLTKLLWKFNEVTGSFYCSNNNLKTLKGAPDIVKGSFYCSDNNLTTLKGAPKIVKGNFYCSYNKLTTLDYIPEVGGKVYFEGNPLKEEEFVLYNL